MTDYKKPADRRSFLKVLAAAGITAQSMFSTACSSIVKADSPKASTPAAENAPMPLRKLGRTGLMSSRLVFGGGSALAGGRGVRLLDRAFEAGINHYDVGSNVYYKGAERHLAPFLKKHRDQVILVSKAPVFARVGPSDEISVRQATFAANKWIGLMEDSLKDLQVDYVDAYYLMGIDNPSVVRSDEMYNAFLKAKKAGKVRFFGLSAHQNVQNVMETAIKTGWYDLAMIAITPAGWYDWSKKNLVQGSPPLVELQPILEKARQSGMGLIGMKSARYLSAYWSGGRGNSSAFDKFYHSKLKDSPLTAFQKTYAYVLQHGMDVVNSDMQNFKHLEENIVAAATGHRYFG
ncbi:MAG: aldo/keto reductase [Proteobacteria bacterium]|nr:aldo/keto reductase [Pseudomonadota bacterium]